MLDVMDILRQLTLSSKSRDRATVIKNTNLPFTEHHFGQGDNYLLVPTVVKTVLVAHYDSHPNSPGANDNGASVVELIAAASEKWSTDSTTLIALVDLEEPSNCNNGMALGSKALAKWMATKRIKPKHQVVLDVCGVGDCLMLSKNQGHKESTAEMVETAAYVVKMKVGWIQTPASDNISLKGSLLCSVLPEEEYKDGKGYATWRTMHSAADKFETIHEETVQQMTDLMMELI